MIRGDLFDNYEGCSIKELIANVLIQEARPMRQFEIVRCIRKRFPKKSVRSSGSVCMMVQDMVRDNIIQFKMAGFNGKNKFFHINKDYVKFRHEFYKSFIEKDVMMRVEETAVDLVHVREILNKYSFEVKTKSLREADTFINGLLHYLVKFNHLTDNRIISEQLFDRFSKYEECQNEDFKNVCLYLTYQSNLKILKEGWLSGKQVLIRTGVKKIPDCETIACVTKEYGNVTFELYHPMAAIESMKDLKEGGVNGLLDRKGKYLVSIKTHNDCATRKREMMFNNFKKSLFNDMIEGIVRDLKEGKKIIEIPDEYRYMTYEQASYTKDVLSLTAFDDIPKTVELIKDFCLKNLKKNKPVTIIDLGVGPAIKPISLYPKLVKHFDANNYVSVDASKNILELAKADVEKYRFDLELQFLHLNFGDITKNPDLILKRLPFGQKVYLYLGGTYGNFTVEENLAFLSSFLRKGDLLAVKGSEITCKKDFEEKLEKYKLPNPLYYQKKSFHLWPLTEIGFHEENIKYHFEYNEKEKAVMSIGEITDIPDTLLPIFENTIKKGQKFRLYYSHMPSAKAFRKELESIGLEVNMHVIKKGRHNLAICRKV